MVIISLLTKTTLILRIYLRPLYPPRLFPLCSHLNTSRAIHLWMAAPFGTSTSIQPSDNALRSWTMSRILLLISPSATTRQSQSLTIPAKMALSSTFSEAITSTTFTTVQIRFLKQRGPGQMLIGDTYSLRRTQLQSVLTSEMRLHGLTNFREDKMPKMRLTLKKTDLMAS